MKEDEDPLLPSWRDSGDKMGDLESVTVRRSSPMSRRESGAGESSTFKTDLVTHNMGVYISESPSRGGNVKDPNEES